RLPITGRAADVGLDDGDAELAQEIVVASLEAGLRLALGAAVDVDHDRQLPRESCGRSVVQSGDLATVEARPANDGGAGERGRVDPSGLALGPAGDLLGGEIERIDITRRAHGGEAEAERLAVPSPDETPDRSHRQTPNLAIPAGIGAPPAERCAPNRLDRRSDLRPAG